MNGCSSAAIKINK